MVLEQIYDVAWLKKKAGYAFIYGICIAVLGIAGALVLFPQDPALVAVAFVSLLLLPSLQGLTTIEEHLERKRKKFNLFQLIADNGDFIIIYILLFLGILLVFAFFALLLPSFATNKLFEAQLSIMQGASGGAYFSTGLFAGLLLNNFKILLLCFVISLAAGAGAIFLISWNASVWGTIFGNLAQAASLAVGKNPYVYFGLVMLAVFPHMILEVLAYILATIAGTLISQAIVQEKFGSDRFKQIFIRNAVLLLVSIAVLVLGALLETYVLNNFDTYRIIIQQGFGG
jgi:uncharacterized membrane protein SpoIIM required for sporulation